MLVIDLIITLMMIISILLWFVDVFEKYIYQ